MNKLYFKKILFSLLFFAGMTNVLAHDIEVVNDYGDTIYYSFQIYDDAALSVTWRGSNYASFPNEYSGNIVIPESVTYNGKTYKVTLIMGDAFSGCSGLTSVAIPNSVTFIGMDAFRNCIGLTSITFPSSVKSMEESTFRGCDNLKTVISENPTPITIYSNAFSQYVYDNAILYVPQGTADKYKEKTGWMNFANIVDGIPASIAPTNNSTDEAKETERYTIDSRRISAPQRGINVVKMSDGTIKKVLVK